MQNIVVLIKPNDLWGNLKLQIQILRTCLHHSTEVLIQNKNQAHKMFINVQDKIVKNLKIWWSEIFPLHSKNV